MSKTAWLCQVRKPFKLGDGTSVSVQASAFHYSTPRNNIGPYTHFEVWPDKKVEEWAEFATGGDGEGPYAGVPRSQVCLFIALHGGLDFSDVFMHRNILY